jgi:hypothetical protein
MKLIILGAGACGFLRANEIFKKHLNVTYKNDRVKFQNGFEVWDKKLGLTWVDAINKRERIQSFYDKFDGCYISHVLIKYVDDLLLIDPTIKFLCLKGNREHQVKSLMMHWGYRSPIFTKRNLYRTRYVLEQFPDYSKEENVLTATEKYYDEYYNLAFLLQKKYPLNFITIDAELFFQNKLNEATKFLIKHFLHLPKEFFDFESKIIDYSNDVPTTALHGGLGNNLFQMAETIAFAAENNLKTPEFCTWDFSGFHCPKNYYPDKFLGGHLGSQSDFTKSFKNLKWLEKPEKPNFDTKFMINDMFDFQSVHHMRDKILEAFEPTEEMKEEIDKKYKAVANGKETVSLHLRMCGLPADDHFVKVPFAFHVKVLDKFPDDVTVLVFSDNNVKAEEYIENLSSVTNKNFVLMKENQFVSLFLMARCINHIMHISTLSFWGAYLDKKQEGKTFYHKDFVTMHTKRMIPYEKWTMIE